MTAIFTLLVIVTISLMVNRIATVALTFTGLSKEAARFQARSAFTGTGFTSTESELIVQHPVRRRIIMMLMFMGNAGMVTVIGTLMTGFIHFDEVDTQLSYEDLTFRLIDESGEEPSVYTIEAIPLSAMADAGPEEVEPGTNWREVLLGVTPAQQARSRVLALTLGLLFLWVLATSKWIDDQLFKVISKALRQFTRLESHDYHGILHLSEGFTVTELVVAADHWLTGRSLTDVRLTDEGIQVLGIIRANQRYIGAPKGTTFIRTDDRIILYGQVAHIDELKLREAGEAGDAMHAQRVEEVLLASEEDGPDTRTENSDDKASASD